MTWKKLFFRTTFHDLKKRSWCMALIFIIQFFVIPVRALLPIQSQGSVYGSQHSVYYKETIQMLFENDIFTFGSVLLILMLILSAVILAMSGFSYLNSRKKVDFIHSMPIKREALFLSRYVAGVLLYMLPLIVNVGITLLIAAGSEGFTSYVFKSALWFLLYHLVYFLLFYGTAILAIVLIGNFVVSLLGMGILFSYQSVMWYVGTIFKRCFFQTYMREYDFIKAGDPIGILIRQIYSFHNDFYTVNYAGRTVRIGEEYYYSTGGKMCLLALFGAVAAGGIALLLFRLRKSEAAGKSLVFPVSEPIIKVGLLLPVGIIGGMIFRTVASGYRTAWYIFGAAIAFLLGAAVIEMIFRQDFKSLFKHKVSALAGAAVIIIFTLCFQMDLLGFDSRIPKGSQIESVGISIPEVEDSTRYMEMISGETDLSGMGYYEYKRNSYYYGDRLSYALYGGEEAFDPTLNYCMITGEGEVEKVRKLAACYLEYKEEYEQYVRGNGGVNSIEADTLEEMEAMLGDMEDEEEAVRWIPCKVVYRLKNGSKVYRTYNLPYGEKFLEVVEPVFANKSYKLAANPVLVIGKKYRYVLVQSNFTEKRAQIARSDQEELMEALRKDVMNLTFEEVWTQNQKGSFYMTDTLGANMSNECPVYESYTNTLDWLSAHGVTVEDDLEQIEVCSAAIDYFDGTRGYRTIPIEDKQEMEDIKKYLILPEFVAPAAETGIETNTLVMIQYNINSGDGRIINNEYYDMDGYNSRQYYFLEIPDFVKNKL